MHSDDAAPVLRPGTTCGDDDDPFEDFSAPCGKPAIAYTRVVLIAPHRQGRLRWDSLAAWAPRCASHVRQVAALVVRWGGVAVRHEVAGGGLAVLAATAHGLEPETSTRGGKNGKGKGRQRGAKTAGAVGHSGGDAAENVQGDRVRGKAVRRPKRKDG